MRQPLRHRQGDGAVSPRCEHAEADEGEHVEAQGAQRIGKAQQQGPADPEDHRRGPDKLHPARGLVRDVADDGEIHAHGEEHHRGGHGGAPAHAPPEVLHFIITAVAAAFGLVAAGQRIFLQGHAAVRAGAGCVRTHALAHGADVGGGRQAFLHSRRRLLLVGGAVRTGCRGVRGHCSGK